MKKLSVIGSHHLYAQPLVKGICGWKPLVKLNQTRLTVSGV